METAMRIPRRTSDHSFTWFTAAQFLGALNDNLFRWLILYFLIATLDLSGVMRPARQSPPCLSSPFCSLHLWPVVLRTATPSET